MPALIELVQVTKRYALDGVPVTALDGVSFQVEQGSVTGIVGRSGSGKSTLLNLLGGLDRPTSGEVVVAGTSLSRRGSDELARYRRETIGFVFQSFHLIPHMSALDNVVLPLALAGRGRFERTRHARELLERVGLATRERHRPRELSGGERQRVALARALANDPKVLLADEPTGSLDSKTAEDVLTLLCKTGRELGRTVVIVTHEREQAQRYCDRLIELADGKIVRDAPTREPAPAAPGGDAGTEGRSP